jgi:hypothetical protein
LIVGLANITGQLPGHGERMCLKAPLEPILPGCAGLLKSRFVVVVSRGSGMRKSLSPAHGSIAPGRPSLRRPGAALRFCSPCPASAPSEPRFETLCHLSKTPGSSRVFRRKSDAKSGCGMYLLFSCPEGAHHKLAESPPGPLDQEGPGAPFSRRPVPKGVCSVDDVCYGRTIRL